MDGNNNIEVLIVSETRILDSIELLYVGFKDMLERKNFSVEYVECSVDDLQNLQSRINHITNMDMFFYPFEMSMIQEYIGNASVGFTSILSDVLYIMVAPVPLSHLLPISPFGILVMDNWVTILLIFSIFVIGFYMTFWNESLLDINCKFSLSIRYFKRTIKNANHILDNMWRTTLILFFEPYITIPQSSAYRVVISAWLLAATIFYFELTGDFTADFTCTQYDSVGTIKEAVSGKKRTFAVPKGSTEGWFVTKMAEEFPDYERIRQSIFSSEENQHDVRDILFADVYIDIMNDNSKSKVFLITDLNLRVSVEERFKTEIFAFKEKMFISPPFNKDLYLYLVSPHFKNTHKFKVLNSMFTTFLETKTLLHYFYKMYHALEILRWVEPEKVSSILTMDDLILLLLFYISGNAIAVGALLVENNLFAKTLYYFFRHILFKIRRVLKKRVTKRSDFIRNIFS